MDPIVALVLAVAGAFIIINWRFFIVASGLYFLITALQHVQ